MSKLTFQGQPPQTERLNAYDEAHLATYVRLLDAAEEGADWREVAHIVFGLDVEADPERAKRMHDSHLARARWMTESGFQHLLQPRMQ
ncbi:DNA -binding domain-containing protein [Xanthobacter sediminis]